MNVPRPLCDPQTLERFLTDRLSAEQCGALEDHLEQCPSCQASLERMAAEDSWWGEVRGYLSDAPEEAPPALGGLESYLVPSEDPRMLGRLGGYEVVGIVGRGGMGVVLKAWDAPLSRYVAIKVLAPHLAPSAAARQRFAREARAAAAVVHDNVMAIHAVAEANGLPYLVMPYVPGPSLEKRLRQSGALPVLDVLRIGRQIAAGLAAAHAQGLVHRDIKPANILLEEGVERVRITDFGLARAADDASLTRSGMVAGTPQYMSPEQAADRPVDHRSDLFSLGSVLYALCTGGPPFRGRGSLAVLRHVEEDTPRPIRQINPDIPDWLVRFIDRLHAKDPADRFQSAAEVALLLEGYLAHRQHPTRVPAPHLQTRPRRRYLLPVLVLAALAVLGAGVLALALPEAARPQGMEAEYRQSFRGYPDNLPTLRLLGPDAEQCVRFEPAGLRLALLAGPPKGRVPTGVTTGLTARGDFDIEVSFEVLAQSIPADPGNFGTRLSLMLELATPVKTIIKVSRGMNPKGGEEFIAWEEFRVNGDPRAHYRQKTLPATAKAGRLRLVRAGEVLSYFVAEEGQEEFTLLQQHPVDPADVKDIAIVAGTSSAEAVLDARVTDLHVRAGSLPSVTATGAVAAAPSPVTGTRRGGLALAVLPGLGLLLAAGAWLFLRQGRRPAAVRKRVAGAKESAKPKSA